MIVAWLIVSFLILYQIAGGYDYLASRALTLLIPIFSILLSWGIYITVRFLLRHNRNFSLLIPVILILIFIYPLTTQSLSEDSQQMRYGLTYGHVQELDTIKNTLASGTVLSDPTTMYLLTTLGGMSPAYSFEHTNLTRKRFIEWEHVKRQFLLTPDDALQTIEEIQPDYIVISSDTKQLFPDSDYTLYNQEGFTIVYDSNSASDPNSSHHYVFYSVE